MGAGGGDTGAQVTNNRSWEDRMLEPPGQEQPGSLMRIANPSSELTPDYLFRRNRELVTVSQLFPRGEVDHLAGVFARHRPRRGDRPAFGQVLQQHAEAGAQHEIAKSLLSHEVPPIESGPHHGKYVKGSSSAGEPQAHVKRMGRCATADESR
jgi:hypothetical protein